MQYVRTAGIGATKVRAPFLSLNLLKTLNTESSFFIGTAINHFSVLETTYSTSKQCQITIVCIESCMFLLLNYYNFWQFQDEQDFVS